MKSLHGCRFAAMLLAVTVVCAGALILGQKVNAAAEGAITGTVKLSGTAPHMKGIDMSKDPYCVKQHENSPAHLENVVVGQGDGLGNVVLYISEGLTGNEANAVPSEEPIFDQKGCVYAPHVLAMDVNQKFKVITSDQTTHNIHPLPNARNQLEDSGNDFGEVQHPSLDARLFRCSEGALCDHRQQRRLHDS
ncbi:MAG: hypothetical protein LAO09_04735 [Acidobacteriia bacterium]|nr:hypothetical protein [Terriglobia bacterium]